MPKIHAKDEFALCLKSTFYLLHIFGEKPLKVLPFSEINKLPPHPDLDKSLNGNSTFFISKVVAKEEGIFAVAVLCLLEQATPSSLLPLHQLFPICWRARV